MAPSKPVTRKERKVPFQQTTPEIVAWRDENPLTVWAKTQKFGAYTRMAETAGVSVKAVYAWLAGRSLPAADVLLVLCDRAKVDIREYIEWWNRHPGQE